MILTGKALEDFSYKYNMSNFNEYSEVLQNALIIEFFDSFFYSAKTLWEYCFEHEYSNNIKPWKEIVKQAIIKANEIYNENRTN